MERVVEVRNLRRVYPLAEEPVIALAGIDRQIDPGQCDHRLFDERVDAAQFADFDNAVH